MASSGTSRGPAQEPPALQARRRWIPSASAHLSAEALAAQQRAAQRVSLARVLGHTCVSNESVTFNPSPNGSREELATQWAVAKNRALHDSQVRPAANETLVAQNNAAPAAKATPGERLVPSEQVASNTNASSPASAGGWYARKRDEVRPRTSLAARDSHASQPLDTSNGKMPQVLSRPQPLSQPQQTILEWSRPPQSSTGNGTMLR